MIDNEFSATDFLTGRELAAILRRFAALYDDNNTRNAAYYRSIMRLAKRISNDGDNFQYFDKSNTELPARGKFREKKLFDDAMQLQQVRNILSDLTVSKADLIALADQRFGIARGRLNRSSLEEVIAIITAAADHEQSLDIIAKNAASAGKS